jgi:hypothetical protein
MDGIAAVSGLAEDEAMLSFPAKTREEQWCRPLITSVQLTRDSHGCLAALHDQLRDAGPSGPIRPIHQTFSPEEQEQFICPAAGTGRRLVGVLRPETAAARVLREAAGSMAQRTTPSVWRPRHEQAADQLQ